MGRLTVFMRSDDLNSKQLLKELERRSLPYAAIDVALYPSRCQDLHAIVDVPPSVPHVFFNTRYVGGLDSCIQELAQWDKQNSRYPTALEKYTAEIASAFDPTNKKLSLPDPNMQEVVEKPAKARKAPVELRLPDGTNVGIRKMMEDLRVCVPVTKHKYKESVYEQSFTGRTLSASLQNGLGIPEDQAVRFCRKLFKEGLFCHVDFSRERMSFEYDHLYHLQCDAHPRVLNSYLIWRTQQESSQENPMEIVDNLHRLLNVMELSSIDPEDGLLNSKHAVGLLKFAMMEEAMCELQQLSKSSLMLLSERAMTVFALNLYSLMVRYAYLKVGIPREDADRRHWLNETEFLLAGDKYNLQEWLDVVLGKSSIKSSLVLEGNSSNKTCSNGVGKNTKKTYTKCHKNTDDVCNNTISTNANSSHEEEASCSSAEHLASRHDKRIHFALFVGPYFGSRWSTSFARFSEEQLDEQLDIAAQVFCLDDHHVRVNRKERKLELLASVFRTHRSVFATKESDLPKAILPFLTGSKRLDLTAMMSSNKAINIAYLNDPSLGSHTIEGPWYHKKQPRDCILTGNTTSNIAVKTKGRFLASVMKKVVVKTK